MPRCQYILDDGSHCNQTAVYNDLCIRHLGGGDGASSPESIARKIEIYAGATAAVLKVVSEIVKILGPHIKMQGRGDIDLEFIQEQAGFILDMANSSDIDSGTLDAIHHIYLAVDREMEALLQQVARMAVASEAIEDRKEIRRS